MIASEILRNEELTARVSAIEKWVAVADICRCLHNYNAVLEITSSLNRSAIFRLKKTWLKVSKQVGTGRAGAGLQRGAAVWSVHAGGSSATGGAFPEGRLLLRALVRVGTSFFLSAPRTNYGRAEITTVLIYWAQK